MEFENSFGSRDEYGAYRDKKGFARGIDGDAIEFLKTTSRNCFKGLQWTKPTSVYPLHGKEFRGCYRQASQ
ncbi:hypothetical protein Bca52824_035241 [Brassica carinata]|uniref:Uncharacterized protein n=1 Tax=Brassica carinata TaxID=52824 RepID=A0A8X7V1J3_BRACI|nr:hypothetical protein Bca52824_035241 [Brassica carinata]